ncbi:hypothetical protein EXIGLDRAFT_831637 [Exidia glandulosa HHB12029]|uniref:Chitinase n=1 Tax=Exidia glandulosa HHB12029 TaxID=1314781 RepID=A0A165MIA9_EXIGL|nr:hypothetical protein EXIGLDRAFT_831637 [Exidia glandulosa HHB12029]
MSSTPGRLTLLTAHIFALLGPSAAWQSGWSWSMVNTTINPPPPMWGSSSMRRPRSTPSHSFAGSFTPETTSDDYVPLSAVPDIYDVINMDNTEFDDDPSSPTYGGVKFGTCLLAACVNATTSEVDFKVVVKDKLNKRKRVQLTVYWNFGDHVDETAQDKYFDTVTSIIDEYRFNGLALDLSEFPIQKIPAMDVDDDDYTRPTTPFVVDYISTLRRIKARYDDFTLSFLLTSSAFQGSADVYGYHRTGAYLPLIHAFRADVSSICVHHFDPSNDFRDRDGVRVLDNSSDYWVAMLDRPLAGFTVVGKWFPPFPASQVIVGARDLKVDAVRSNVLIGLQCVTMGQGCEGVRIQGGPFPDLLGAAMYTIREDESSGGQFRQVIPTFFDGIVPLSTSKPFINVSAFNVFYVDIFYVNADSFTNRSPQLLDGE